MTSSSAAFDSQLRPTSDRTVGPPSEQPHVRPVRASPDPRIGRCPASAPKEIRMRSAVGSDGRSFRQVIPRKGMALPVRASPSVRRRGSRSLGISLREHLAYWSAQRRTRRALR